MAKRQRHRAQVMFITGKNHNGRYATNVRAKGANITRNYPQKRRAEFNAAILAELCEKPGTPMSQAFARWTVTENGWKKDRKQ
jgi:hypothetical protein